METVFFTAVMIYIAVVFVTAGFLYKKVGTLDGPDGLLPLYGAIFWPITIAGFTILYIIGLLLKIGATIAKLTSK